MVSFGYVLAYLATVVCTIMLFSVNRGTCEWAAGFIVEIGLLSFIMGTFVRAGRQYLRIFVPVPQNISAKMSPLLLDRNDAEIYAYLKSRSRLQKGEGGIVLAYCGEKIYAPAKDMFTIKGTTFTPHAIRILKKGRVPFPGLAPREEEL